MSDTWTHSHATGTRSAGRTTESARSGCCGKDKGCTCSVCAPLHTFERPRFFAGQLLTESELTLLQHYVIDKQRLHNVHLHGWGVVCGLQVRCDDCGDGVIVEPGYAIDPCGNDIVVPGAQRVDVMGMIQRCAMQVAAPCDPPRYELPEGCDDQSTWCLYVRYREWNTRAVTPLAGNRSSCSCGGGTTGGGCGCGGSTTRPGWECTCGSGGSANASTCGCGGSPTTTTRSPECEPTRTKELYEFGVCRSDGTCGDLRQRLAGTFPLEAAECLTKLRPIFDRHVNGAQAKTAAGVLLDPSAAAADDDDLHDAICALYDAVLELYRTDPMRTMCVLPAELAEVDCSPRGPNEETGAYQERMAAAARAILMLIVAYIRDCICYKLMPPCPDSPCDDRVILACMTVRDGRVVDICNLECRRHAGSFVSRNYWLPIGPLVSWVIGMLCCAPLLGRGRGRLAATDRVRMFVAQRRVANLRQAIVRDDFAVVRGWNQRARSFGRSVRPSNLLGRADQAARPAVDHINLSAYVNREPAEVRAALGDAGVTITETRTLGADEALPVATALFPAAVARDRLIAYERGGRIVGFAKATSGAVTNRAAAVKKAAATKPAATKPAAAKPAKAVKKAAAATTTAKKTAARKAASRRKTGQDG